MPAMPDLFDPYPVWLDIVASEQPTNHYELLSIGLFEDDLDLVAPAVDWHTDHLRTFQSGKSAAHSQKPANKLAAARSCLRHRGHKADRDALLRKSLRASNRPALSAAFVACAKYLRAASHISLRCRPSPWLCHSRQAVTTGWPGWGKCKLLEKAAKRPWVAGPRALHSKLNKRVVVKMLSRTHIPVDKSIARSVREVTTVGSLDHRNIVRAFDAHTVDGKLFLVVELLEAHALQGVFDHCESSLLTDASDLAPYQAIGLQYAHLDHLVHGHTALWNPIVTRDGQFKFLSLSLPKAELTGKIGEKEKAMECHVAGATHRLRAVYALKSRPSMRFAR